MIGRWIWRWFEFPAFEDEAIRQVTVRFYTILLLSIGLNLGYMVVLLITGRGIRMSLVGSLVILLLQCAGLLLAKRVLRGSFMQAAAQIQRLTAENEKLQKELDAQKQSNESLRDSQQQYQALVELSPAALMVHGTDGQLLYLNAAAANLLGAASADAVMGKASADFMPQDHLNMAAAQLARAETGKAIGPAEYRVRRSDQQPLDVHIHSMVMRFQGQLALLDVVMDLTAQKRAQQELITSEIMKIELNKEREIVDLKEQFVSMVSHEFRNPLTTILASKEILERYSDRLTPHSRQEHLRQIGSQVQFMVELLNNVLTISRAQAHGMDVNLEATDLAAFSETVFKQVEQHDAGKHPFQLQTSGDLSAIPTDRRIVTHILNHLLTNAVKYSPEGTPISLEVRRERDTLTLAVQDKGIGIPADDQPRLYELFYRARNATSTLGSGLGLGIVKACVDSLGGLLTFESQEGSGTTFTVKLPCVPAPRQTNPDGQSSS